MRGGGGLRSLLSAEPVPGPACLALQLTRTLMPDPKIGQNKLYNFDEKNTSKQAFLYLKQLNNINYIQKVK